MTKLTDLCGEYFHEVFEAIEQENRNQIQKWGIQTHDIWKWLGFTLEELGELAAAVGDWEFRGGSPYNVIKEATQAATLLCKIREMFENSVGIFDNIPLGASWDSLRDTEVRKK